MKHILFIEMYLSPFQLELPEKTFHSNETRTSTSNPHYISNTINSRQQHDSINGSYLNYVKVSNRGVPEILDGQNCFIY